MSQRKSNNAKIPPASDRLPQSDLPARPVKAVSFSESLSVLVKNVKTDPNRQNIEALVGATQLRLYRFCLKLVGSPQRAEDLAQEVYLKAFSKLSDMRDTTGFYVWLCTIAKNTWIDQTRTAEHKVSSNEASQESDDPLSDPVSDPRMTRTEMEQIVTLRTALSRLDPESRLIILLAHQEEMTAPEIAKILGVSVSAVRMRLLRARQEFFRHYEGEPVK